MKLVAPILLSICLYGCSNNNRLTSENMNNKKKRIQTLRNEIEVLSELENVEFDLYNVNGFSNSRATIPGASSYDYKICLKVNPDDVEEWLTGMFKFTPTEYDDGWMTDITLTRKKDWKITSEPEFYTRKGDNVILILYRKDGIIFKRLIQD